MPSSKVLFMREIAEEVLMKDVLSKDMKTQITERFFDVARKYGIKQGTKTEIGRSCNTFEWTMLKTLFLKKIEGELEFYGFLGGAPKDLLVYEEEDTKET